MKEKKFITIPCISGIDDSVTATICNATFEDKRDGTKRYGNPIFGEMLIEEIYNRQKLFARKAKLFGKSDSCPECKTKLDPTTSSIRTLEFTTSIKPFEPYTVKLTLPTVECPNCKKICVLDPDGKLGFQLGEALIKAFDSENIKL